MINLRNLFRQSVTNYIKPKTSATTLGATSLLSSSSSSSSSSDDEKKKDLVKKKSNEAREKLNLLLTKMIQEDASHATTPQLKSKLDLAKPIDRRKSTIKSQTVTKVKIEPAKQMLNAVKEVAKVVGGDIKQTESELLQKLLNPVKEEKTVTTANNLSEIFKDMKIDRKTKPEEAVSRAQQVRQILESAKLKQQPKQTKGVVRKSVKRRTADQASVDHVVEERVNLFGKETLGIFPSAAEINTWPEQNLNKTWNILEERELRLATLHPPANYFQQMIQWTEQGKLWRFPIDNEQDMPTEKSVYFAEHVFLEKHIDPWCPPKGPIRHFMELVLVGLSKNHYLTVEDKREHIEWFRNYFNEKRGLLQEVEAIPADFEFLKNSSKKLEP